jgi:hypothetical protein
VGVFDCSRRAGERIFLRNLRTSSRRYDCEIAAANAVSCQSLFESISLNLRPSGKAPPVRKASIRTGDVPTASAPRVRWRHTYRMLLQWSAPSPRCASRPHRDQQRRPKPIGLLFHFLVVGSLARERRHTGRSRRREAPWIRLAGSTKRVPQTSVQKFKSWRNAFRRRKPSGRKSERDWRRRCAKCADRIVRIWAPGKPRPLSSY